LCRSLRHPYRCCRRGSCCRRHGRAAFISGNGPMQSPSILALPRRMVMTENPYRLARDERSSSARATTRRGGPARRIQAARLSSGNGCPSFLYHLFRHHRWRRAMAEDPPHKCSLSDNLGTGDGLWPSSFHMHDGSARSLRGRAACGWAKLSVMGSKVCDANGQSLAYV
jgi:hypothetical protein